MNYFTEYWYVWIIFAIMCVFLFSFYGKKFKQVKEKRKQYEEKLAQEKDMFSHLKVMFLIRLNQLINKSCYFSY